MDVKLLRLTTGEDIVAEMVYSDALITKGLLAFLIKGLNELTPKEIVNLNKKFLEEMFSKAPQTTLGIKKILTLDTKKGIARAVYSAKKNMCHSGNIVQGGFITGWLDAIMALACMCKVGSDVLVLSLEIKVLILPLRGLITPQARQIYFLFIVCLLN